MLDVAPFDHAVAGSGIELLHELPDELTLEDIAQLERRIRTHPNYVPAEGYPVRHYFGNGWYAREVTIWAGHCVVGKVHKSEHFSFLTAGTITVITTKGRQTLSASAFVPGVAGTKRIGAAHTDVVWTTFHLTNETDLDKIEAMLIEEPEAPLCLG